MSPSPEHAKYRPLLTKYMERVEQQEAGLIEAGLPAEGYAEFVQGWFEAWNTQDMTAIEAHLTDDCSYIDTSSFGELVEGLEATLACCQAGFDMSPDLCFYPQDDTLRSLPYPDYFEGRWRLVIPWRAVGRMSGTGYLPQTDIKVAPSGRCMNGVGIDRYTIEIVEGAWKISHIDTDYDMLYLMMQISPIQLSGVPTPVVRGALAVERLVMPALRRIGRAAS